MNDWLKVNAASDTPEILIDGFIGESWWDESGNSNKRFNDTISKFPASQRITVRINSEGGSIQDGLGIYNTIKARGNVTTRIDGYALSIASVIALGGDEVISPQSAVWMIHDPWSGTVGDADTHRKSAEMLDKHADALVAIYASKTGMDRDKIRQLMKDETWMTGEEAVENGFADKMEGEAQKLSALKTNALFRRVPSAVLNCAPISRFGLVAAAGGGSEPPPQVTNTNEKRMDNPATQTTTPKAEAPTSAPDNAIKQVDNIKPVIDRLDQLVTIMTNAAELPRAAAPVSPTRASVEVTGDAFDRYDTAKPGAERRSILVGQWSDITKAARTKERFGGVMNNTISATLTTSLLSDTVVTILQSRLAPIRALFTEVLTDPVKPLATIQVPKVTVAATAQTDPTDWESGDTTVTNTAITMHEYSVSFHVTSTELNSGTRMDWLTRINAAALANKIMDVILTPVTTANFGAAAVTSSAAAFGASDVATLWAALKDGTMRNLVIDGAYWARLIPQSLEGLPLTQGGSYMGFDGAWYNNRWTGAGTNVVGFACSPEAMVIASGLPLEPPGASSQFASIGSAAIPEINVQIQTSSWLKPGTRVQWQAYDLMLGVAACDTTALKILTSA